MSVVPVGRPPARPAGRLQHEAGLGPAASAVGAVAIPVVLVALLGRLVEGGDGGASQQQRLQEGQLRLGRGVVGQRRDLDVEGGEERALLVFWLLQREYD